jgi:hypothetical protein
MGQYVGDDPTLFLGDLKRGGFEFRGPAKGDKEV